MAPATRPDLEAAQRFLGALGAADWEAIRTLLADDVRLRALVPSVLREAEGPDAVLERFRLWWAELDDFRVLESTSEPSADQVRIRYLLTGTDPEDGPVEVEQQCYFTFEDGRITKINSVCSGFRPADPKH